MSSRVLDWIGRRLASLFDGGGGAHAVLFIVVIALAVLIVFAVRAGAPSRRARAASSGDADPLAAQAARDHRRLAAELEAQGRRAEALREWLRAAVQTIEQRGVLPPRPGRTGAATAREAGPLLPTAAADLDAAMRSFDEIWFGGRPAIDDDVRRARAAAAAVASSRIARVNTVPNGMAAPW